MKCDGYSIKKRWSSLPHPIFILGLQVTKGCLKMLVGEIKDCLALFHVELSTNISLSSDVCKHYNLG